jgi:hypothetical protein
MRKRAAKASVRFGRFETRAPADRRDHQVKTGMLWQPTFFDDVLRRSMRGLDLHQDIAMHLVMLTKMSAEAALSIMN